MKQNSWLKNMTTIGARHDDILNHENTFSETRHTDRKYIMSTANYITIIGYYIICTANYVNNVS